MGNVKASPLSATVRAPGHEAGIALGLGLTNECNLTCAFCYRDPDRTDRLSLDQVKSVMERLLSDRSTWVPERTACIRTSKRYWLTYVDDPSSSP